MSHVSRTQARAQPCPACGASVGARCIGARGKERESVHRERMQSAAKATGAAAFPTLSLDGNKLVDAEGAVLGRLVGLEIDLHGDPWGTYGGEREGVVDVDVAFSSSVSENTNGGAGGQTTLMSTEDGEQATLLPSPRSLVWEHYQERFDPKRRRTLDRNRTRCIDRALKVRTVEECCRAIDAMAADTWAERSKYNDIEYALGRKSDSPDAVIDRWLEKAPEISTDGRSPHIGKLLPSDLSQVVKDMVFDHVGRVRRSIGSEHPPTVELGQRSMEWLRGRPACAEPIVEGGKLVGWRRVTA